MSVILLSTIKMMTRKKSISLIIIKTKQSYVIFISITHLITLHVSNAQTESLPYFYVFLISACFSPNGQKEIIHVRQSLMRVRTLSFTLSNGEQDTCTAPRRAAPRVSMLNYLLNACTKDYLVLKNLFCIIYLVLLTG